MGRRSPNNERYQKHTSPAGKTRKSAAAAKPKRAGAAPGKPSSASKGKQVKGRAPKPTYSQPTTPEYKRLRMIWWAFLAGAIALSTASFFMWKDPELQRVGNYVLGAGYACIFIALYIDWTKLRPLRQQWIESGGKVADTDATGSEKPVEKPSE